MIERTTRGIFTCENCSRKAVLRMNGVQDSHHEISVIIGMFPNAETWKRQGGCRFGDKCAFRYTAQLAYERNKSSSIAIDIPSNDERQIQPRKNQSDDKTQYRVRRHHSSNMYVLKRDNLGPTFGVIQTGSQNQRTPNAPTCEERSFEWTLSVEEETRKAAWISHKNVFRVVTGSYCDDRHNFFTPRPAKQCFFTSYNYVEWENSFWTREHHSIRWVKSDLTPEQQETIQKSKGPSGILIARGTIHATEEATVYVCDLDLYVQVQWLKEPHPRYFYLRKLLEESGSSYEWLPGQPSYLFKNGKKNRVQNRWQHSLGCPRRASNQTSDRSIGRLEADTSCGRPRAMSGNRIARMASTVHGRINEGDPHVRQTYLHWT